MKVILREDVKNKGAAGEIIEAKSGYVRNYLIPQGFAYPVTEANLKAYERERIQKTKKFEQLNLDAEKMKSEIENISLTAVMKVGDDGKLYGVNICQDRWNRPVLLFRNPWKVSQLSDEVDYLDLVPWAIPPSEVV